MSTIPKHLDFLLLLQHFVQKLIIFSSLLNIHIHVKGKSLDKCIFSKRHKCKVLYVCIFYITNHYITMYNNISLMILHEKIYNEKSNPTMKPNSLSGREQGWCINSRWHYFGNFTFHWLLQPLNCYFPEFINQKRSLTNCLRCSSPFFKILMCFWDRQAERVWLLTHPLYIL